MRLLVCGGRKFEDWTWLNLELTRRKPTVIIHGGAPGADTLAGRWAGVNGVACRVVFADWDLHGKKAGPIRNQQMLDDYFPEAVLAFPGGTGTADMVRRALAAGLPVEMAAL